MNQANKHLKILVVDDSAVSRKLAEITLSRKPYELSMADSAEQALKLFETHHPDVVITDWMMPGLSGPQLCQIIRNKLNARDTYLILLTRSHLINARTLRKRRHLLSETVETQPNHRFPPVPVAQVLWLACHRTIYETSSSLI